MREFGSKSNKKKIDSLSDKSKMPVGMFMFFFFFFLNEIFFLSKYLLFSSMTYNTHTISMTSTLTTQTRKIIFFIHMSCGVFFLLLNETDVSVLFISQLT